MWPEGEPDEDTFGVNGEPLCTFNKKDKVAEKKPFSEPQPVNITQVIAEKLERRSQERCKVCGHMKVKISSRRNWDGSKFVWRCNNCRRNNRKSQSKKHETK